MLDHEPDIYVSPATIWEVTIKQAIGKLQAPTDPSGASPGKLLGAGHPQAPSSRE
jgi:PIN domain nuclease of toxin-antitoxin system